MSPMCAWQERTAIPSIWTVQAPHCATPQPYLGLVIPSSSRNTQSKGISGTTSTWCLIPLTVSSIMSMLPFADVVVRHLEQTYPDRLLRCRSRFFDQCCHFGCVRKKDCVAARKFNDLRLRPLRHETLEVRIDHPVLHGNHCVVRLLFPGRNRGLRLQCIT